MMGEHSGSQSRFFYRFNLEDRVPADHLLRKIDAVLDLSKLRSQLAPHYSHTGRPSIDPELMIRMLLIGYCYGIRSERRLCEEVDLNLAYRWFCRLNLDDAVPDHSTFSKNRHGRFRDADILRHVFETTVQACMDAGLVGGEGFAVDASITPTPTDRTACLAAMTMIGLAAPMQKARAVPFGNTSPLWIETPRRRRKSRFPTRLHV